MAPIRNSAVARPLFWWGSSKCDLARVPHSFLSSCVTLLLCAGHPNAIKGHHCPDHPLPWAKPVPRCSPLIRSENFPCTVVLPGSAQSRFMQGRVGRRRKRLASRSRPRINLQIQAPWRGTRKTWWWPSKLPWRNWGRTSSGSWVTII